LKTMQSSAPLQNPLGLPRTEASAPAEMQIVGVSAAWRKLIMQAQMAAPHVQIASLEGEHGSGKYTLARYLYNCSPLVPSGFQRRDAREWLVTDADPSTLAGFTYLDRVDLLAPPGQGLLLGVLKAMQDRPPGRAVVLTSSQTPLRQMAGQGLLLPDLAFRLSTVRFAIPPCARAAKTFRRSPKRCWRRSAPAISSGRCRSAQALWPACSSTLGRAMSASSLPSWKPRCLKPPTA